MNAESILEEVRRALALGNLRKAEEVAAKAPTTAADDFELNHLLGCARLKRGDAAGARIALARAMALNPEDPVVNYNFANACGALGDFRAAAGSMLRATVAPALATDAWFKLGTALGHHRNWPAAAAAMLRAARLDPNHADAMMGMGACALQSIRAGLRAPPRTRTAPAHGRLSFIVCSIRPEKLARLRARLEVLLTGDDWELVPIADARSLCEGYNRGVAASRGELLVLCHDDILLLADDFERRLRGYLADYELIGVAGGTRISGPSWTWSGPPHIHCWIAHLDEHGRPVVLLLGTQGPVISGARALDGVLLAGRRDTFERVRFDEDTFDGFHLYDIDFSYRAARAGVRSAACLDLGILHESEGRYDDVWTRYAEKFLRKFGEIAQPQAPLNLGRVLLDEPGQLVPLQDWLGCWTVLPDIALDRLVRAAVERL